jgi:hypothetical protein
MSAKKYSSKHYSKNFRYSVRSILEDDEIHKMDNKTQTLDNKNPKSNKLIPTLISNRNTKEIFYQKCLPCIEMVQNVTHKKMKNLSDINNNMDNITNMGTKASILEEIADKFLNPSEEQEENTSSPVTVTVIDTTNIPPSTPNIVPPAQKNNTPAESSMNQPETSIIHTSPSNNAHGNNSTSEKEDTAKKDHVFEKNDMSEKNDIPEKDAKTEKNDEKEDEIKCYHWPKLSIDEIITSLKVVGNLNEPVKLKIIDDKYLAVDTSFSILKPISRYFYDQGREKLIHFLDHLLTETKEIVENIYQNVRQGEDLNNNIFQLQNILGKLFVFMHKYETMRKIYEDDSSTHARLGVIRDNYYRFLNDIFRKIVLP